MHDDGGRVRDYGPYVPGGETHFSVQSIMATFKSVRQAEKAADALKKAGYRDVQIARVATDPSVSSMAAGYDLVTTQNVLLTVVIEHDRFDEAEGILKEYGGDY